MKRNPEDILNELGSIAAELHEKQSRVQELLQELADQTPEMPEVGQQEQPPMAYHLILLHAAYEDLVSSIELLDRICGLGKAEIKRQWREEREVELHALLGAVRGHLAVSRLAVLSDEEISQAIRVLSAIRKAAVA